MIIAISFLLISALMLWLLIGAKGPWKIKLVASVIVPFFMFAVWHALGSYEGWPVRTSLPHKSVLIADEVIEPDVLTHQPGVIYVWLIPINGSTQILGYHPTEGEPRAYRLPYSRQLQNALNQVSGRKGLKILQVKRGKSTGHGSINDTGPYHAYVLPNALPPKGGSQ